MHLLIYMHGNEMDQLHMCLLEFFFFFPSNTVLVAVPRSCSCSNTYVYEGNELDVCAEILFMNISSQFTLMEYNVSVYATDSSTEGTFKKQFAAMCIIRSPNGDKFSKCPSLT